MNNNFINSYYKYIEENYDLEVNPVHTKGEHALKVLINEEYPFALIKFLDKNFDKNQTFKTQNGSLKIFIPPWLKI